MESTSTSVRTIDDRSFFERSPVMPGTAFTGFIHAVRSPEGFRLKIVRLPR